MSVDTAALKTMANRLRRHSILMTTEAGSGHPSTCMSAAEIFAVLYFDEMRWDPKDPSGDDADVLVLSKGHAAPIQWAALKEAGAISDDLMSTSITTFLKRGAPRPKTPSARVRVRDFWGRADAKRRALLASLDLEATPAKAREECAATPEGPRPYEDVTPTESGMWRLVSTTAFGSYEDWPALDDLFVESFQGVNPNRGLEGSVIDTDRQQLERRMKHYFSALPFDELAEMYPELCEKRARFDPRATRETLLRDSEFRSEQIVPYVLFPLDSRFIYYESFGKFLNEKRLELWTNCADNQFLVGVPQPRRVSESRPLVASGLFDLHFHDRGSAGFPARVVEAPPSVDLFTPQVAAPKIVANLAAPAWEALKTAHGWKGDLTGPDADRLVRSLLRLPSRSVTRRGSKRTTRSRSPRTGCTSPSPATRPCSRSARPSAPRSAHCSTRRRTRRSS